MSRFNLGKLFKKREYKDENLFPYLITIHYTINHDIAFPINKEIYCGLVRDRDGLVESITTIDSLGMSIEQAHKLAIENLSNRFASGLIKAQVFEGPENNPFLVISNDWCAAATILLPNILDRAKNPLKSDQLYFSIPHRDCLIVFPHGSDDYIEKMKKMIIENESEHPKQLTFDLFKKEGDKIIQV